MSEHIGGARSPRQLWQPVRGIGARWLAVAVAARQVDLMSKDVKSPLRPEQAISLAVFRDESGTLRRYGKGEAIFHFGDPGEFVFLVQSGLIEISVTSLSGRKSVLAWVGPGEVLGEISALDGGPRSADAVAAEACKGLIVSRASLLKRLASDPEIALELIASLCGRIRNASDGLSGHALTTASAKLATCLLRLAEDWAEPSKVRGLTFTRRFSQSDLGAFAGIARENVSRQLSRMSEMGLLSYSDGFLELHDTDGIADLLDDTRS